MVILEVPSLTPDGNTPLGHLFSTFYYLNSCLISLHGGCFDVNKAMAIWHRPCWRYINSRSIGRNSLKLFLEVLTLFQLLVFLRSVQMATNQKVLSNRASDKSRVCGKGSIITAVSIAFQKGGGRHIFEQGLALYTRL